MTASRPSSPPRHAFTVDVEEYFHVNAFESVVNRSQWPSFPSRLDVGMERLLELLESRGMLATFFVLGWVANRHADLVRRLHEAGHEVASHGFWHHRVVVQTPAEFREDVTSSKKLLEDIIGAPVLGYRAPSFSIIRETEWALAELVSAGFVYDSSRFPIHRPGYGSPHVGLASHTVSTPSGSIFEVPLTVLEFAGQRLPAAGGGWFRQFPRWVTEHAIAQQSRNNRPAIFYIHPWELDPDQPRVQVGAITRFRHYRGLQVVEPRIALLLDRFAFGAIRDVFREQLAELQR